MTILDDDGIQAQADGYPDSAYEITVPVASEPYVCPITDKHVLLAFNYFKNNWLPGRHFNFRLLSRLTKCRDDGGNRDFTADGIHVGAKLSSKQVEKLFNIWLAERDERFPEV